MNGWDFLISVLQDEGRRARARVARAVGVEYAAELAPEWGRLEVTRSGCPGSRDAN